MMWPWGKKARQRKDAELFQREYESAQAWRDYFEALKQGAKDLQGISKTMVAYNDIKRERRAREEKKMKLETGKKYMMSDDSILVAQDCHHCQDAILGRFHYDRDTWKPGYFSKNCRPPSVVSLVTTRPKLTLIPGELYAMEDGKVERCYESAFGGVRLGNLYYDLDGTPVFHNGPQPLHRLRVNEHMKEEPGQRFRNEARKAGARIAAARDAAISDMMSSGHLAPYQIYDSGITVPALQGISASEAALAAMPAVTYRNAHSETERCRREVVVPEGWERCDAIDATHGVLDAVWVDVKTNTEFLSRHWIRPVSKPFKITGPGWYRTRGGGWIKNPRTDESDEGGWPSWNENGNWFSTGDSSGIDLIARATDAQAAILDAL